MPSNSVNLCWSYAPFELQTLTNMQFSALFSFMLWYIEMKFRILPCFTVLQIKFECRQLTSRPGLRPSVRHIFPHFPFTCFEILSSNFVQHFILMHVRSSSNAINFRQFVLELCPFWTSNSYKYAVFRTFLLHALIYWDEFLHITLF